MTIRCFRSRGRGSRGRGLCEGQGRAQASVRAGQGAMLVGCVILSNEVRRRVDVRGLSRAVSVPLAGRVFVFVQARCVCRLRPNCVLFSVDVFLSPLSVSEVRACALNMRVCVF
jgi:hypothetical protein